MNFTEYSNRRAWESELRQRIHRGADEDAPTRELERLQQRLTDYEEETRARMRAEGVVSDTTGGYIIRPRNQQPTGQRNEGTLRRSATAAASGPPNRLAEDIERARRFFDGAPPPDMDVGPTPDATTPPPPPGFGRLRTPEPPAEGTKPSGSQHHRLRFASTLEM